MHRLKKIIILFVLLLLTINIFPLNAFSLDGELYTVSGKANGKLTDIIDEIKSAYNCEYSQLSDLNSETKLTNNITITPILSSDKKVIKISSTKTVICATLLYNIVDDYITTYENGKKDTTLNKVRVVPYGLLTKAAFLEEVGFGNLTSIKGLNRSNHLIDEVHVFYYKNELPKQTDVILDHTDDPTSEPTITLEKTKAPTPTKSDSSSAKKDNNFIVVLIVILSIIGFIIIIVIIVLIVFLVKK